MAKNRKPNKKRIKRDERIEELFKMFFDQQIEGKISSKTDIAIERISETMFLSQNTVKQILKKTGYYGN